MTALRAEPRPCKSRLAGAAVIATTRYRRSDFSPMAPTIASTSMPAKTGSGDQERRSGPRDRLFLEGTL